MDTMYTRLHPGESRTASWLEALWLEAITRPDPEAVKRVADACAKSLGRPDPIESDKVLTSATREHMLAL